MPFFAYLTNPDTVLELFESVQAGILVIDKQYRVVLANIKAGEIIGEKPNCLAGTTLCHDLLFKKKEPCDDCPAFTAEETPWPRQKSIVIKKAQGEQVLAKVFYSQWMDHIVLTIHDVTKEVNLLRKVDRNKKELQAKNILLERRRQEISEERRLLEQLWDSLPEALVTVDATCSIERKNQAVGRIFPGGSSEKCFELVGHEKMCDGCPASHGFSQVKEGKKSHQVDGRYFTEIITSSPSGAGGLLLFRDTTRQIQLIGEIRGQREAITRKNEILSNLVLLSAQMQKGDEAVEVIRFFIDLFLSVIKAEGIAVIVNDSRAGNLKFTEHKGLTDEEMKALTRAYLSREIQTEHADVIPKDAIPFAESTQVVLSGGSGKRVGLIVVSGKYEEEEAKLLSLFTEPLGPYIHNQLLMQQLEEKANTDPMTGLFNRGYMEQAMEEELEKLNTYQIHYAVVVADVNGLKKANDGYGHEAGDHLITTVAKLLKKAVRQTDIVARTGGDEFLLLLTNTTSEQAEVFLRRLDQDIFHEVMMPVGDNEKFPVSISLGAASTDQFPPETIVREADRRMYLYKENFYRTRERYR